MATLRDDEILGMSRKTLILLHLVFTLVGLVGGLFLLTDDWSLIRRAAAGALTGFASAYILFFNRILIA